MDWKKETMNKLRDYPAREKALDNILERMKTLSIQYTSLRAAGTDGSPVSGGTNKREDMMISNIAEREELKKAYRATLKELKLMQRALSELTSEEQLVLDLFYMHRKAGYVDELCKRLNCERTQIYVLKDRALRKLTLVLYGITEL